MRIVTLTTDFGTRDGYVGEMKGVLLDRAPEATLVDVTHDLEAGDVRDGAWALARIWSRFPPETVHLAVVDPGVGTDRKAVAVRISERWLVGPDNGLLSRIEGRPAAARELSPDRVGLTPFSDTFHGRDLFAPAAAYLAAGSEPAELGPELDPEELVRLPVPEPRREGEALEGEVVHVDRFGNLITNLPSGGLPDRPLVEIGAYRVEETSGSFAEAPGGSPVVIRGSGGTLEICVRNDRAAEVLGLGRGEPVTVRPAAGGSESGSGSGG